MGNNTNGNVVGMIVMEEEEAVEEIWCVCAVLGLSCVSNHKIQAEFTHFLAFFQAQAESY